MNKSAYTIIEGFKCYAPELAYQYDNFPTGRYNRLTAIDENNFWHKTRNLILIHLFKKYVGTGSSKK
jgi:hypothetical protein